MHPIAFISRFDPGIDHVMPCSTDMTEEEVKEPESLEDWKAVYIKLHGQPFCENDEDWQELFEETHFKQRYEARGQFVATQEFMETEM